MEKSKNIERTSQTALDPTKHNYDLDGFPDRLTYKHTQRAGERTQNKQFDRNYVQEPRSDGQSQESRQVMSLSEAISELVVLLNGIREKVDFKDVRALSNPLGDIVKEMEFMLFSLSKYEPNKILVRYIDLSFLRKVKCSEDRISGYRSMDVLNGICDVLFVLADSDQKDDVKDILNQSYSKIQNLVQRFSTNLQRGFDDFNIDRSQKEFEDMTNPVSARYPEGE